MNNSEKQLILDRLQLEAIPLFVEILRKAKPEEFNQWGGNCCRQVAAFAYVFLMLNIEDFSADDEVAVFEATYTCNMKDKGKVEFDHSWLFLKHGGDIHIIDYLPSVHGMRIIKSQGNSVFWGQHAYLKNVKEITRKRVDTAEMLSLKEFYTDRLISSIYAEILDEMNR